MLPYGSPPTPRAAFIATGFSPPCSGKSVRSTSSPYPLVYLLDAEFKLYPTAGILDMLYQRGYPAAILVGLPNPDNATRSRDLTPTAWDREAPQGGGADAFGRFIAEEVTPAIESRYRTRDYRLLVGHSYGGLFATHMLTTRPELFDAFVAISPSMHYDDRRPLRTLERILSTDRTRTVPFFIAMGAEPGEEGNSINALYSLVAERAKPWLDWSYRVYPDETHVSVVIPATMDGLRFAFRDFVLEGRDLPDSIAELEVHFAAVSKRVGWTVRPSPRLLMNLAYHQMRVGDAREAVATLDRFVTIYPSYHVAWYSAADVHEQLGHRDEAIAALERLLELYPDDVEARLQLERLRR